MADARAAFPIFPVFSLLFATSLAHAQQPDATEFFEKSVRPVLAQNCQPCHNAKTKTSGLDLSTAAGFAIGGAGGPVIAEGHPENSRILKAIGYDDTLKMPPTGKLKPEEIAVLTTWVKLGATWPADAGGGPAQPAAPASAVPITAEQRKFWAFQPVKDATPPKVKNSAWVKTPIDQFILAKLEEKGLTPARPAGKAQLLRRATFDLTGLPPTKSEIQAFLADSSPSAYAKVIERLLASPRYGERWGRHWLDVVRYADSTGNDEDHRYPYAYRYRDYVIQAFNDDMPYDRFVREQLAGDLLPPAPGERFNRQGMIATGFLALGAKALAQKDHQKMMYDIYDEQVDVTSRAFLGLTMACARCHNHKFDPILTKDYYSFVNIFANTRDFDGGKGSSKLLFVPLVPAGDYQQYRAQRTQLGELKISIDVLTNAQLDIYYGGFVSRVADYMLAARKVSMEKAGIPATAAAASLDRAALERWVKYLDQNNSQPYLTNWKNAKEEDLAGTAAEYERQFGAGLGAWRQSLAKWEKDAHNKAKEGEDKLPAKPKLDAKNAFFAAVTANNGPLGVPAAERDALLSPERREKMAQLRRELDDVNAHLIPEPDMACAVTEGEPVDQKVFLRGDYNNLGEDAPKAVPTVLRTGHDPSFPTGSGRLTLAEWLTRADNPMTARVMVNRIWQGHFGEGIVRTPDNFGRMGERPTHPELLDYLAAQFVRSNWSVKAMHRAIMLSSAYQMSSEADAKTVEADPENLLVSHFNRQRLDVEEIRDALLAIDGSIDLTMGGTLQTGFGTDSENSAGRLSLDPTKLTRRTVYLPLRRANLPTLLNLFDFGDATTPNGKRSLTNVAPQALFMMNSDFVFDRADRVAKDVLALPTASDTDRLREAFLRIVSRTPDASETDAALSYMKRYAEKYGHSDAAAGWQSYCHILMASNDFVYVD